VNVSYADFLAGKRPVTPEMGQPVESSDVHPILFPHQRAIVEWAVRGGRRAIFAAFGLGKSIMQLETCRLITPAGKRALIICPLGVRAEFAHDAALLGTDVTFIRRTEHIGGPGIYITNYESVRDGKLDISAFTTVSLDEASVLRSYGSKTFITFLELFDQVPFRFVATATPSPNRYKELIHYAGFLGVMDTGQALTRFFQRDSTKANSLTLYAHKEREFWLWLASWAVFLQTPADLGYPDEGYALPELEIVKHEVEVDQLANVTVERDGQSVMFHGGTLGVSDAAKEKRSSLDARIAEMTRIIRSADPTTDDQIVLWCDLNDEQRAIERALDAAGISYSSVYGSLSIEESERRIAAWKNRETVALIGKPVMLGQGLNLQQCNRAIFLGLTYKFNDIIQATHRIHRFGQSRKCWTHIIHCDTERSVIAAIDGKWRRHEEMTRIMSNIIRDHGLNNLGVNEQLLRSLGVERVEALGEGWLVANNDCVPETEAIETNSVDLIVTSIPFANHYEYTPSYNDFGHTDDNDHFWAQMDFLTPQLLRVLRPGRIYACHVKDRILFGNVTGAGAPTVSPFHAEALMHGRAHGFDYMGMITVVTDVVRENNQTYRLGWSENAKDGTKMGVGSPEYVLLFRKPQTDRSRGYADVPVAKDKAVYSRSRWQVDAHAHWRSNGNRHLTPEEWTALGPADAHRLFKDLTLREVYDFEAHVRIGEEFDKLGRLPATFMMLAPESWHPDVWTDVVRMLTLNGAQSKKAQALHVCPLQFDIVDRLIERYSNPGELVYDPFGGLFTVPYRALAIGRRGRAVELNPSYFLDGVKYLQAMERQMAMPALFDLTEGAMEASA
jgi:DNA modification methylase